MGPMKMPDQPMLTVAWVGGRDGFVRLIDQTLLPTELVARDCKTVPELWEAIRALRVRGAPAIGVAAAFGTLLGAHKATTRAGLAAVIKEGAASLRTSRPTAVNLFWAIERMEHCLQAIPDEIPVAAALDRLLGEARELADEDRRRCRAIGKHGAALIGEGDGMLTHCNAGGLAAVDYGMALAIPFRAAEEGRTFKVFVDETRPLLQGARLTTWELQRRGIDTTLICDNMAAQVMREGRVQLVIVGADRIAANGDTANKIGTYGVAVLAAAHGIPFFVAAPISTFDLKLASGDGIPIEQRDPREVTHGFGKQTAPADIAVYNPAFDVTPARLIAGIITERGIIRPVSAATIAAQLGSGTLAGNG